MDKKNTASAARRHWVQFFWAAATNGYVAGYAGGTIFTGAAKSICVPGLNCYSCPGATFACPIGALQAVLGSRNFQFSFYMAGFFLLIGAALGRFVCGFLCPFGLVQDLIHKIPFVKKLLRLPGEKALRFLKYAMLAGFVVLLPLLAVDIVGQGAPWFCKYICPSGTLFAGIPLLALEEALRGAAGALFWWKFSLMAFLLLLSIVVYRPFCRYLCPLGAIYGFFNPIALYRYRVDGARCTRCKACQRACRFDIPVYDSPNSMDCIRCGDCRRACPTAAICPHNALKKEVSYEQRV